MRNQHLSTEVEISDNKNPNYSGNIRASCWISDDGMAILTGLTIASGASYTQFSINPALAKEIQKVLDGFIRNYEALEAQMATPNVKEGHHA